MKKKASSVTNVGILVGEDNWTFFEEINDDLSAHYQTEVYKEKRYNVPLLYGRLNRWALHRRLRLMLQRNDVCFFEWASDLLMQASYMPKRCVMVTRLHSFELFTWAPKINWDAVDIVILLSLSMQRTFCNLYPEHSHKTEVIHNGVSLTKFRPLAPREFKFRLGMLCNISPIKRVYEMVLTLYGLKMTGYAARLHIGGSSADDFRYAKAIYRLVEKLDMKDDVVFDGYIDDSWSWMQHIDIFISNSYWEGQQVALLEAMASGCYCLSHAWDGAEEVLPSDNLYVTDTELIEKIVSFLDLPESEKRRRQDLMRAITCEKFDIERTKARVRKIIAEVA